VTLKIGFDFLRKEKVSINNIVGHGGFFTTKDVGQRILSAALNAKVTVNKNASEGGPYGMALLAKYLFYKQIDLNTFLNRYVFKNTPSITLKATPQEIASFNKYTELFKKGLSIEKEAINQIKIDNKSRR
jgi:sugar (pentulose or hexulose) kinase